MSKLPHVITPDTKDSKTLSFTKLIVSQNNRYVNLLNKICYEFGNPIEWTALLNE